MWMRRVKTGKVFQSVELRALDLAVPVGALDQPHHQPPPAAAAEVDQPVDREDRALLVGLDHEADAVPAREFGLEAKPLQQVERDLQPVGFLGIDVDADIVVPRLHGQFLQARIELGLHALPLGTAVARMQRRELDRNAGPFVDATALGGAADRMDRPPVGLHVLLGLRTRDGGLAQHVVGMAEALLLERAAVRQRLVDGLAGDELFAHQAHGEIDAGADQRLAALRDQARQGARQAALAAGRGQPPGQQQAPGRGVHEQRRAVAEMRTPVAAADLVADQRVARLVVGDAQQRLGQAHQRHALLAGERIFVDQPFDAACRRLGPQRLDQPRGQRAGPGGLWRRQAGLVQKRRHALDLGLAPGRGDGVAQRTLPLDRLGKSVKRHVDRQVI